MSKLDCELTSRVTLESTTSRPNKGRIAYFPFHSDGETIKRVFVGAIAATLRQSGVAELEFKRSLAIGRQLV